MVYTAIDRKNRRIPTGLYQPGNEMENGLNVIVRSPTHNREITHIIVNNIVFIIISLFVNWQFHKAHPYCFALPSSGMSK